jgi:hypothetical protein
MYRSPGPRKKSAVLSDSLNHHLNMYAVAAGAAGVGMLALAQPAEARVVYSPAFQEISERPGPYVLYLDLNHDGINDFQVNFFGAGTSGFSALYLNVYGANPSAANAMWKGTKGTCFISCASALPAGVRVGGTNPSDFSPNAGGMARITVSYRGRWVYGYQDPWAGKGKGVTDRYLGLRFSVGGQTHYGWARFNVSVKNVRDFQNIIATLTGYAYETVPNKSIRTGDTGPFVNGEEAPDASLTKPASPPVSLGLLALGAPGLEIWRREEKPQNN